MMESKHRQYDFESVKPDRSTDCMVYNRLHEMGIDAADAIPFAVAEMMFPTAPEIIKALHATAENSYFGYMQNELPFRKAVCAWLSKKGVSAETENIVPTHGVVAGLGIALRAFSSPGDAVLIQPPVYGPFRRVVMENGRRLVENRLVQRDERYEMDLADMEEKLKNEKPKLFILCSPHNPVGRVWERETLERVYALCKKNHTQVIADEIHQDILPFGAIFTPYATIDPSVISFSAASKTFDIAGLSQAYAYSADKEKVKRLKEGAERDAGELFNPFGMAATSAAYEHCERWMGEMLEVVAQNIRLLDAFLREELPMLHMTPPEGTYLCWVDLRELKLSAKEKDALMRRAGMEITDGTFFGTGGEDYIRVNVACPAEPLRAALKRLKTAVLELNKR